MIRCIVLCLLCALLSPWSLAAQGATPTPAETPVTSITSADVRVMSFNVWLGGEQVDLDQVIAAIKAADAAVVGVQEAEGRTREIVETSGETIVVEWQNAPGMTFHWIAIYEAGDPDLSNYWAYH